MPHSGLLVILRGDISHKNFWQLNPSSGVERQLTDLSANFAIGDFDVSPDGTEIARGLVNYSAAEARRILGKPSGEIEAVLGYIDEPELIHRDNLVLL